MQRQSTLALAVVTSMSPFTSRIEIEPLLDRARTSRSMPFEADLAVAGAGRDAGLAGHAELDVGDGVAGAAARDLDLDLEALRAGGVLDLDRIEEPGREIGAVGADALVDADLDVVAVLADDAGLAVGVVDADRAAGGGGHDQALFATRGFGPGQVGEEAAQQPPKPGPKVRPSPPSPWCPDRHFNGIASCRPGPGPHGLHDGPRGSSAACGSGAICAAGIGSSGRPASGPR